MNFNIETENQQTTNVVNTSKFKSKSRKTTVITAKQLRMMCVFCTNKLPLEELWHLNIQLLNKFINVKGQIKNKIQNKLCSKHQRNMRIMIIRARHIHLLPYIV